MGRRKVSLELAANIRFMYGDGDLCTVDELAEWLDVSPSTIRRAITAKPKGEPSSLSVKDVAAMMNVSTTHVYDLVREGAIASQRHGRLIRITREALSRYLKNSERGLQASGAVYDHLDD